MRLKDTVNRSATTLDHTIQRDTGGFALPVPDMSGTTIADTTDFSGGLAAGYIQNFAGDQFFVGAEAFYNFETAETKNINGVLVTEIDLNSTYGGRLLAGANATDKLSLYAHGGVTVTCDPFSPRNSGRIRP